jgi:hypothetical protein
VVLYHRRHRYRFILAVLDNDVRRENWEMLHAGLTVSDHVFQERFKHKYFFTQKDNYHSLSYRFIYYLKRQNQEQFLKKFLKIIVASK